MNDTRIREVVGATRCAQHNAEAGTPCWSLRGKSGYKSEHYAICGKRIKSAGFVGQISPESVRSFTGKRAGRSNKSARKNSSN